MKNPPLEFLVMCSGLSLREFELNRLTTAANLRKHIREIQDELSQAEAEAVLARWLIEYRDALLRPGQARGVQCSFEFQSLPELPAGAPAAKSLSAKMARQNRKELSA